jgi:ankyrin repeat protein
MKYIKTYEEVNSMDLIEAAKNNNLKKVKKLIKAGANLDIQDNYGNTALMWASCLDNLEIVKKLIKVGANWNLKKYNNNDFLDYLIPELKNQIITEFPEEYQLYLAKKDAEKYNL